MPRRSIAPNTRALVASCALLALLIAVWLQCSLRAAVSPDELTSDPGSLRRFAEYDHAVSITGGYSPSQKFTQLILRHDSSAQSRLNFVARWHGPRASGLPTVLECQVMLRPGREPFDKDIELRIHTSEDVTLSLPQFSNIVVDGGRGRWRVRTYVVPPGAMPKIAVSERLQVELGDVRLSVDRRVCSAVHDLVTRGLPVAQR